jgi:hypothetical protein
MEYITENKLEVIPQVPSLIGLLQPMPSLPATSLLNKKNTLIVFY